MGTKMGPSYACLFMGYIEHQIMSTYTGPTPEYFGRYIDDCLVISSLSEPDLLNFVDYANNFNPSIKFTYEISQESIPFLDILIQLNEGHLSSSVYYYKPTASHAYLDYRSSHPIGYFQFSDISTISLTTFNRAIILKSRLKKCTKDT